MRTGALLLPLVTSAAALWLLSGCAKTEEPPATEPVAARAAAKVNGEVISFEQVRDIEGVRAADEVDASALDRLVDLTLLAQAARTQGLDKDPDVARRLEASTRVILARAYLDRMADGSVRAPSTVEARKYYDEHPELFAERRTYQLRELRIAWPAAGGEDLKKSLQSTRSAADVDRQLAAKGLRFTERQILEPAERLPLPAIKQIAQLAPGQSVVLVEAEAVEGRPGRARVLTMVSSRATPRALAEALPAIESFLHKERRRLAGRDHVAELRANAQVIKYAGDPLIEPLHARQPPTR